MTNPEKKLVKQLTPVVTKQSLEHAQASISDVNKEIAFKTRAIERVFSPETVIVEAIVACVRKMNTKASANGVEYLYCSVNPNLWMKINVKRFNFCNVKTANFAQTFIT